MVALGLVVLGLVALGLVVGPGRVLFGRGLTPEVCGDGSEEAKGAAEDDWLDVGPADDARATVPAAEPGCCPSDVERLAAVGATVAAVVAEGGVKAGRYIQATRPPANTNPAAPTANHIRASTPVAGNVNRSAGPKLSGSSARSFMAGLRASSRAAGEPWMDNSKSTASSAIDW